MFGKFIHWTEIDQTRFRKVILMIVVIVWIISTLFITMLYIVEIYKVMSNNAGVNGQSYSTIIMSAGSSINYFYAAVCAALVSSYGFFTGTNVSLDIPKQQLPMNQTYQTNSQYGYQQGFDQQAYVNNTGSMTYQPSYQQPSYSAQASQTTNKTVLTPHPITGKPTTLNPDD